MYKRDHNGNIWIKVNRDNYINLHEAVTLSLTVSNYDLNGIMRLVDPSLFLWQQKKTLNERQKHPKKFTIEVEDIKLPKICPVTEQCWTRQCLVDIWGTPLAPSIDRLDNNKGYEKGNILILRYDWNTLKGNYNIKAIEKMIKDQRVFEGIVKQQYEYFSSTLNRLGIYSPKEFLASLVNNPPDDFDDWWSVAQERLISLRDIICIGDNDG